MEFFLANDVDVFATDRRLISLYARKKNPLNGVETHPFWYDGQKKKANLGQSRKPFYQCS